MHECGEVGHYGELKQSGRAREEGATKNTFERDHIPAKRTLLQRAKVKKKGMSQPQVDCVAGQVEKRGVAIVIPASAHRGYSPTCGSKNKALYPNDAKSTENMNAAVDRDIKDMQDHLNGNPPDKPPDPCAGPYAKAAEKLKEFDFEKMIDEAIKHCVPGRR
jgi:hypothetical protein